MKLKTYCIHGFVERYVTARLGKGSMIFHFRDGVIDNSGRQPAVYVTANPVEQSVLENHPEFKSGAIKLMNVKVIEDPKNNQQEDKKVTVDSVTTLVAARQYLLEHGATAEELQNKAAILGYAAKHDIVFPNWK